jgi:pimeloyl-ACP methyl ester carboxylesterase
MRTLSAVALVLIMSSGARSAEPRPFPGTRSRWNGFARHDFVAEGARAVVVEPEKPLRGRPWAWYGQSLGVSPNADSELLRRGWHLAYLDVPDLFGCPGAVARWEKFYDLLVHEHGLSPRPALTGVSRGALYCTAWATSHPGRTLLVYLDNGVCDFRSWPGGRPRGLGTGLGSPEEWAKLLKAYGFKDDKEAVAYKLNPVDNLKPLADAKVPLLLVYGDADRVVPHRENSEVVYERYKALGGPVERVVKPGKDHHPHGLDDPRPVAEFFGRAWRASRPAPAP